MGFMAFGEAVFVFEIRPVDRLSLAFNTALVFVKANLKL